MPALRKQVGGHRPNVLETVKGTLPAHIRIYQKAGQYEDATHIYRVADLEAVSAGQMGALLALKFIGKGGQHAGETDSGTSEKRQA